MKCGLGKTVLTFALCFCMALTSGCSTAWEAQFGKLLDVALPAVLNILQIVSLATGKPVDAALKAKIQRDYEAVDTLAKDFADASAGAAPGVQAQLNAAMNTLNQDMQVILATAQISNEARRAQIAALVALVTNTIQMAEALIPQKTARGGLAEQPALNADQFVSSYNKLMTARLGDKAMDDAAAKLALHKHSKAVRVLSLGLLK